MGEWSEIGVKCWLPKSSEIEVGQITHFHNVDCDAYEKRIAELVADKQIRVSVLVDNEAPFFGAFWSEERDGRFGIIVNLKNCAALGESEEQFNQVVQDTLAHELMHAVQAAYGQMFSETQVREALEDPAQLESAEDAEQMIQQMTTDLIDSNNRIAELEAEAKANIEWQEIMTADIAATKRELARVKAESLHVVVDPDSEDWCMTPTGLGWYGTDSIGNSAIETPTSYHDIAQCRKVRLERWETEDGN